MISVPNHRLQLNGSSIAVLSLLFLTLCLSCTTTKKATGKDDTKSQPSTEGKVRVFDPKTGTYVLVPKEEINVDTVEWTEEKTDPLLTDKTVTPEVPVKKSHYEVSLLIPLNSLEHPSFDEYIDPRLIRFMQYYGGMRIAAEEIKNSGLPIVFRSYDTENSGNVIDDILNDPGVKRSEVIVGPYDKDRIERVADYGLANEKIVISPWLPAFSIDKQNPYFIQILPGLDMHADAIMDYISQKFPGKKIFLVARNNSNEIQRLLLFKKNPKVRTEDLIIDDESIDLEGTNLGFLLDYPEGSVFVMPYYSRQDENFVNSFLRKLHADKGENEVIVFGLPQWTSFNHLNTNYMESLQVHISSPSHINNHHPDYRDFRNKFYSRFFTMPDNNAYLGYDLVMWIGKTIASEGITGFLKPSPNAEFGLTSGFNMKPVFQDGATKPSEMKTPLYYENSKVLILKFQDQDYLRVY